MIYQSGNLNPRRSKVFFGWWIVIASCAVLLYVGGTAQYGFTAIVEPLVKEFGWSYAQVSLGASLRGMEAGLFAPVMGMLVDRWGPRKFIIAGAFTLCLGLVVLSRVNSLAMYYAAYGMLAVGASFLSGTVVLTALSNWFRKGMARASSFVVSGLALGALMVPLVTKLISLFDWRAAMFILGIAALFVVLPLSILFRHRPEQYGYLPDGDVLVPDIAEEHKAEVKSAAGEIPVRRPAKRAFWFIAFGAMSHALIVMAINSHIMPYLSTVGIARSVSSMIASAVPIISIGGRLGFGWLGYRLDKRWLAAAGFACMAVGLVLFGYVAVSGSMWLLVPFVIFFGTGWGCNVIMRVSLLSDYFDRKVFGRTYGLVVGVSTLGLVFGAPLAGWVYDTWGAYQGIWFAFVGVDIIAAIITLMLPPYKEKPPLSAAGVT